MIFDVNVIQLQGARPRQEDSYLVRTFFKGLMVLVADGLGGHERGDEAGRIACLIAYEAFERFLLNSRSALSALRKAFVSAHKAVQKIPAPHRRSPASTLVAGFFSPESRHFFCASVGDSLAILLKDGRLIRLFHPQTESGAIIHALGLDIGDALGSAIALQGPIGLQLGDRLLIATDGIEGLSDEQILMALGLPSARESAECLAQLLIGMQRKDQDNATLAVVHVA